MQKQTRSILEELESLYSERKAQTDDSKYVIESRANNIISSAIRLLEQIDESYSPEQAENLTRKLLNAIKCRDPKKFVRSVRRAK